MTDNTVIAGGISRDDIALAKYNELGNIVTQTSYPAATINPNFILGDITSMVQTSSWLFLGAGDGFDGSNAYPFVAQFDTDLNYIQTLTVLPLRILPLTIFQGFPAVSLQLDEEGNILLLTTPLTNQIFGGSALTRLLPDGTPDQTFASNCIATQTVSGPVSNISFSTALIIQPDGRLVTIGLNPGDSAGIIMRTFVSTTTLVTGRVSDSSAQQYMPNVIVVLTDASDAIIETTTTNSNGSYVFSSTELIVGDDYRVTATPQQPNCFTVSFTQSPLFTLQGGTNTLEDLTFIEDATITGIVIDSETALGLPSVSVSLYDSELAFVASTLTNSTGEYTFSPGNLVVGEDYRLTASAPVGYSPAERSVVFTTTCGLNTVMTISFASGSPAPASIDPLTAAIQRKYFGIIS